MKAIVCNQFGQPNTLQYQEVATSLPGEKGNGGRN